jgi:hypothetical protein
MQVSMRAVKAYRAPNWTVWPARGVLGLSAVWGMSRRLLKFSGGSSDDYATWRSPSALTRPS